MAPEQPEATIKLDNLYDRPAYITGLQSFLDEADHNRALAYWLNEFVAPASLRQPEDIILAIQRSISDIDQLVNDQVNAIIHHRKFQALEASWRGLWYLTGEGDGIKNIKIKALDVSWNEVSRDISRAMEFDQSQLFKKIYSEEYGTPGGEPYGVIIGDYEISHKNRPAQSYNDVVTLEGLAQISAASFAPFIAAAAPSETPRAAAWSRDCPATPLSAMMATSTRNARLKLALLTAVRLNSANSAFCRYATIKIPITPSFSVPRPRKSRRSSTTPRRLRIRKFRHACPTSWQPRASRIAHFLKVMARDKIGSFMEATEAEEWLNKWISNYFYWRLPQRGGIYLNILHGDCERFVAT